MEAEELDSKEKLEFLAMQVVAVRAGKGPQITCPYCGEVSRPSDALCCPKYLKAMEAVLERFEAADKAEFIDRIMNMTPARPHIVH
jgi:uncharacterized OB-fold protein